MGLFIALALLLIVTPIVLAVAAILIVSRLRTTVEEQRFRLGDLARRLSDVEKALSRPTEEARGTQEAEDLSSQAPVRPVTPAPSAEEQSIARLLAAKAAAGPAAPPEVPSREKPAAPAAPAAIPTADEAYEIEAPPEPSLPPRQEPAVRPAWSWRNFEEKAGKVWLTWAGAFVLILAAGFLAKYAFDRGWLGPLARVVAGLVLGLAAAAAGERFIRRKMTVLGQGLLGAGIALMYVTLYAAYAFYGLWAREISFASMVFVTAGAMTIAVVRNALPVSILAVLGAFLTPVILKTGTDRRDLLFAYILVVDLGVLVVSFIRRWRSLDILATAGTWILYCMWYAKFYDTSGIAPALVWLCAFYLLFLLVPFANHFRTRTPLTLERLLIALSNAVMTFALLYLILRGEHRLALSLATFGLAAVYTVAGILTRLRIPQDTTSMLALIAFAVAFATAAPPIYFEVAWTTVSWAIEAPLLVYLSYRYRYFPVRILAAGVLALLVARFFLMSWPLHEALFTPFINTEFATGLCVAGAAAAFSVLHQRFSNIGSAADRIFKLAAGIAGGLFFILVVDAEMTLWLAFRDRPDLARAVRPVVWALGACGFTTAAWALCSIPVRVTAGIPLVAAAASGVRQYIHDVQYALLMNVRFAGMFLAAAAFIFFGLVPQRARRDSEPVDRYGTLAAAVLGWLFLLAAVHAELHLHFSRLYLVERERAIAALVWSIGGLALLVFGVARKYKPARLVTTLPLVIASLLVFALYTLGDAPRGALFINLLFISSLVTVLSVFGFGFMLKYCPESSDPGERQLGLIARICATAFLVLVLSAEVHSYCIASISPYDRARWAAQMSVSLVWALYAMAMLSVGFWRRTRSLRIAALALFALTGLKVVIVDIASVRQIFRILALFILAVTMLGGSYLYHRLEKTILQTLEDLRNR